MSRMHVLMLCSHSVYRCAAKLLCADDMSRSHVRSERALRCTDTGTDDEKEDEAASPAPAPEGTGSELG